MLGYTLHDSVTVLHSLYAFCMSWILQRHCCRVFVFLFYLDCLNTNAHTTSPLPASCKHFLCASLHLQSSLVKGSSARVAYSSRQNSAHATPVPSARGPYSSQAPATAVHTASAVNAAPVTTATAAHAAPLIAPVRVSTDVGASAAAGKGGQSTWQPAESSRAPPATTNASANSSNYNNYSNSNSSKSQSGNNPSSSSHASANVNTGAGAGGRRPSIPLPRPPAAAATAAKNASANASAVSDALPFASVLSSVDATMARVRELASRQPFTLSLQQQAVLSSALEPSINNSYNNSNIDSSVNSTAVSAPATVAPAPAQASQAPVTIAPGIASMLPLAADFMNNNNTNTNSNPPANDGYNPYLTSSNSNYGAATSSATPYATFTSNSNMTANNFNNNNSAPTSSPTPVDAAVAAAITNSGYAAGGVSSSALWASQYQRQNQLVQAYAENDRRVAALNTNGNLADSAALSAVPSVHVPPPFAAGCLPPARARALDGFPGAAPGVSSQSAAAALAFASPQRLGAHLPVTLVPRGYTDLDPVALPQHINSAENNSNSNGDGSLAHPPRSNATAPSSLAVASAGDGRTLAQAHALGPYSGTGLIMPGFAPAAAAAEAKDALRLGAAAAVAVPAAAARLAAAAAAVSAASGAVPGGLCLAPPAERAPVSTSAAAAEDLYGHKQRTTSAAVMKGKPSPYPVEWGAEIDTEGYYADDFYPESGFVVPAIAAAVQGQPQLNLALPVVPATASGMRTGTHDGTRDGARGDTPVSSSSSSMAVPRGPFDRDPATIGAYQFDPRQQQQQQQQQRPPLPPSAPQLPVAAAAAVPSAVVPSHRDTMGTPVMTRGLSLISDNSNSNININSFDPASTPIASPSTPVPVPASANASANATATASARALPPRSAMVFPADKRQWRMPTRVVNPDGTETWLPNAVSPASGASNTGVVDVAAVLPSALVAALDLAAPDARTASAATAAAAAAAAFAALRRAGAGDGLAVPLAGLAPAPAAHDA